MGIIHEHRSVAGNVGPFEQLHLPNRTAEVQLSSPAEPRPLLDLFGSERRVRPAGATQRAHPVQQPVANVATRKFQLDAHIVFGSQLLPDIAPDIVRVHQLAQSHRNKIDRKPVGDVEKRHVQQMHQAEIRLSGRQSVDV